MNAHTSWIVGWPDGSGSDNGISITDGDRLIVRGGNPDGNFEYGVLRAQHARLIAAAPELLELARYAVDNPDFDTVTFDLMARSALVKVTGRNTP